jgi:hypothetical protein
MPAYDFVLTFRLPYGSDDPADFADTLFEAGCDDATLGLGKPGSLALDFTREGASAKDAIHEAIANVESGIPGAELTEVKPDLVNLSDIADIVGCSRQNMRKYAVGEMKNTALPFPAPAFTGVPNLWHLAEVASWLSRNTGITVPGEVLDVATVSFDLNQGIQQRRVEEMLRRRVG